MTKDKIQNPQSGRDACAPSKTVVVFSGGLDSTVLLAKLLADGRECLAFTVNYGQRHAREIDAASEICRQLNVRHQIADLSVLAPLFGKNSLTDKTLAVAAGPYTETSMANTVVPARNLVLLSLATARAVAEKCDAIAYAAHGGDHAIYADCRNEFAEAAAEAVRLADDRRVRLERPFVSLNKTDIVRLGADVNAPVHLSWSCYNGGEKHCGRCATCLERREAFAAAGVPDPTPYA